jgi:hypothetical protein
MKTCMILIIVCTLVLTMVGTIATKFGMAGDTPDAIAAGSGAYGDGGQVINGGWSAI